MNGKHFSSDVFAWKLAEHLLEDFRLSVRPVFHETVRLIIVNRNVKELRSLTHEDGTSVTVFKAEYQLCSLFKKFVFSIDAMSPKDVLEDSKKKFLDNQARLTSIQLVMDRRTRSIIQLARGHADRIWGDFSQFDLMDRAGFGKKSSVGIPYSKACEGSRYDGPMTGSSDHIVWFDKLYGLYNRPALEYAALRSKLLGVDRYRVCTELDATLVDKTWKSKRLIMPNTTIGTLYSKGLGRLIEDRLRGRGYDIRRLQTLHGEYAKSGSISGEIVTADQSLASDNITEDLIDLVLPCRWADALKLGRLSKIGFYGSTIESKTFCTMGIGFTFPLQTLVFLSLLLAIRDELGLREDSTISVFGDDLIYTKEMHETVVSTFPRLGLVINEDKTFSEGSFRESCGHDYYHGFDVRPYHLGRIDSTGSRRSLIACLYKSINGLRRRWDDEDIRGTLLFLYRTVQENNGDEKLHWVPSDYPDTAGVKGLSFERSLLKTPRRDKHGTFYFACLAFKAKTRREDRSTAYLFLGLRRIREIDTDAMYSLSRINPRLCYSQSGPLSLDGPGQLMFEEDPMLPKYRSKRDGAWRSHERTVIPDGDNGCYVEKRGVSCKWTPL